MKNKRRGPAACYSCKQQNRSVSVADPSCGQTGPRAERCSKQKPARISTAAPVRASQRGRDAFFCENPPLLGIPWRQAVRILLHGCLGNKCLLLHTWLGLYRSGHIVQIPDLIPLIARKGYGPILRNLRIFFLCRYIAVPAATDAVQGGPDALASINPVALHIPWAEC